MINVKTIYECGCMASGDNVAAFCPVHGDPVRNYCIMNSDTSNTL